MGPGTHLIPDDIAQQWAQKMMPFFMGEPVYSSVALHHTAIYPKELAMEFLAEIKSHCPIFVGNRDTPEGVRNALFGVGHSHVPTPARDAWSASDSVHEMLIALLDKDSDTIPYRVVVLAAGCSSRAFCARLWVSSPNPNLYIFDFGSLLDWLSGNYTRAWMTEQKEKFDVQGFLDHMSALPSRCYRAPELHVKQ